MKVFILLLLSALSLPFSLFAMDSQKCSKMLNNGLFKTYTYGGVGEAYWNTLTQGTKKDGPFKVSSESSTTEPSTMLLDTKYTSNVWTSQTQSTSSWGDCSAFAVKEALKKDRELYIAQNWDEIKVEVARGEGEHLKVITFYSACTSQAYQRISKSLKGNLNKYLIDAPAGAKAMTDDLNELIYKSDTLRGYCYFI